MQFIYCSEALELQYFILHFLLFITKFASTCMYYNIKIINDSVKNSEASYVLTYIEVVVITVGTMEELVKTTSYNNI